MMCTMCQIQRSSTTTRALAHLLPAEGVVGGDHLAHEHGGGDHDGATGHGCRHQLGEQLLACGEPGGQGGGGTLLVKRGLLSSLSTQTET